MLHVEVTRLFKGLLYGFFGNFVENHPLVAVIITANRFLEVPGNGLPLTVKVGGEVDRIRILGQLFQFADNLFLTRKNLVVSFPVFLWIDPHSSNELLFGFFCLMDFLFLGVHLSRLSCSFSACFRVDLGAGAAGRQITDMAD